MNKENKKQVHYLKGMEPKQPIVQTHFPLINWTYRYFGQFAYSQAFKDLVRVNFFEN